MGLSWFAVYKQWLCLGPVYELLNMVLVSCEYLWITFNCGFINKVNCKLPGPDAFLITVTGFLHCYFFLFFIFFPTRYFQTFFQKFFTFFNHFMNWFRKIICHIRNLKKICRKRTNKNNFKKASRVKICHISDVRYFFLDSSLKMGKECEKKIKKSFDS